MCHSDSYIDFSQFNTALVVGRIGDNELFSNGVGKTVIFRAFEFVLFNQVAGANLEKVIRDDTPFCRIVLDFMVGDAQYRVSRSRTRKGVTDFSLYRRNDVAGSDTEVYHSEQGEICAPLLDDDVIKKYWKDIGGRRVSDTEKELSKLIKCNFTAFRSTQHFMQNDFTGLATATPGKRKEILRDALSLLVYKKLEKIAKTKSTSISGDIDKHKTLISNLGNPSEDIKRYTEELNKTKEEITSVNELLEGAGKKLDGLNEDRGGFVKQLSVLESKFSDLISRKKSLYIDKDRLEKSILEYKKKRTQVVTAAKNLVSDLALLDKEKATLSCVDFKQIDTFKEQIDSLKEKVSVLNVNIKNDTVKAEELRVPIPDDNVCRHCRQPLTAEHKKMCREQIAQELVECDANIIKSNKEIVEYNAQIKELQGKIDLLEKSKRRLEEIDTKRRSIQKETYDKKQSYDEYQEIVNKFTDELISKLEEIDDVEASLKAASADQIAVLEGKKKAIDMKISSVQSKISELNRKKTHVTNTKAVIEHNIGQKKEDLKSLKSLKLELKKLEKLHEMYPAVIQSFSAIPNLIIQNVLDELQVKANDLLTQLKPGLQLSFYIEKTKADGTQDETLDINYTLNGKDRDYALLSGAQKIAVLFSLKLGLSFLLKEKIGSDIKLILLDEMDQSMDKAATDGFADIVKFFQDDFTILVITHNDRLQDKFSHAVLVEQDINMVSTAKVVTSW